MLHFFYPHLEVYYSRQMSQARSFCCTREKKIIIFLLSFGRGKEYPSLLFNKIA